MDMDCASVSQTLGRSPNTSRSWRSIFPVKPVLLLGVIGLVAVCAAIVVVGGILIGSFRRIELAEMQQRATQLKQALEADLRQLDVDNREYAEWDDASVFLQTHNQSFIDANITSETLGTMRIDIVWMVDRHGQTAYSAYRDRATAKVISPAPTGYIDTLRRVIIDSHRAMPIAPWDLTARTANGPLSIAAHEIRLTNRTAPHRTDRCQAGFRAIRPRGRSTANTGVHQPYDIPDDPRNRAGRDAASTGTCVDTGGARR
jgi:sensor domain CHASE-containing protein